MWFVQYVANLGPTMYFFHTTGLQSWNVTFLRVRSPNPLQKASGLGNLTKFAGSENWVLSDGGSDWGVQLTNRHHHQAPASKDDIQVENNHSINYIIN